ncbi:MAG: hypothetical protein K0S21_2411 [Rhizobiaceae bacterium]|jgi:hypothetical protein|nr:hypothetical protein [Rhizobiaceae bacterium]
MRIATLFAACLTANAAAAGGLEEFHGGSLDLGEYHGIVYYTSKLEWYRVVATLASGEEDPPIRFVATLAEGQAFEISVPGRAGEAGQAIQITRADGKLFMSEADESPKQLVFSDD